MTALHLLSIAKTVGIRLEVRGDRLHVEAPIGTLTPELRDQLARHKSELLSRLAPVTDFVSLRGGLVVPSSALLLALDLEARGFRFSLAAAEPFQIEPTRASGPLTDSDRAAIARWRLHLAAIVGYHAPEPVWLQ